MQVLGIGTMSRWRQLSLFARRSSRRSGCVVVDSARNAGGFVMCDFAVDLLIMGSIMSYLVLARILLLSFGRRVRADVVFIVVEKRFSVCQKTDACVGFSNGGGFAASGFAAPSVFSST